MSSLRAELVAEILYGLKKENQYATLTSIARRAGFSPGAQCRTILACMNTIQKDWPHLEAFRAIGWERMNHSENRMIAEVR